MKKRELLWHRTASNIRFVTHGLNLSMIQNCQPRLVGVISLQPLALHYKLDAFFFELELLYFPTCGFGVIVDPEDVLRY